MMEIKSLLNGCITIVHLQMKTQLIIPRRHHSQLEVALHLKQEKKDATNYKKMKTVMRKRKLLDVNQASSALKEPNIQARLDPKILPFAPSQVHA